MRVLKKQDNERKNESKQTAQYSINGSVTTTTIEAVKREIRRIKKIKEKFERETQPRLRKRRSAAEGWVKRRKKGEERIQRCQSRTPLAKVTPAASSFLNSGMSDIGRVPLGGAAEPRAMPCGRRGVSRNRGDRGAQFCGFSSLPRNMRHDSFFRAHSNPPECSIY